MFTPKGKIMALPRGATAVDFAYGVHTDIGHHCVAARINYELLPLRTELKNGDHVEILTSPTARPNPSWLSFVATGKARSRIRHYLKGLQQKESAALGERLLNQALATLKVEPESITWDRWEALQKEYGAKSQLEILADIGLGKRLSFVVAQALTRAAGQGRRDAVHATATGAKPAALTLRGVEGVAIQYAKCCRPIPGDAIIGQFRKGQGLIVHLRDCVTLRKQRVDGGELVDVEWAPDVQGVFDAGVRCSSPTGAGCSPSSRRRSATPTRTSTPCRWSGPTAAGRRDVLRRAGARPAPPRARCGRCAACTDVRRVQRART